MLGTAVFFLSMSLTRLFIPAEIDFSCSTFGATNKDDYKRFANRIGAQKADRLTNICILFYDHFANTISLKISGQKRYKIVYFYISKLN